LSEGDVRFPKLFEQTVPQRRGKVPYRGVESTTSLSWIRVIVFPFPWQRPMIDPSNPSSSLSYQDSICRGLAYS